MNKIPPPRLLVISNGYVVAHLIRNECDYASYGVRNLQDDQPFGLIVCNGKGSRWAVSFEPDLDDWSLSSADLINIAVIMNKIEDAANAPPPQTPME